MGYKGEERKKNLIPPVSGEVRNPQGNNQYTTFKKLADKHLKEKDYDKLFEIAKQQAEKGDYRFWSDLMDRVFGKAQNNHNVQGNISVFIDEDDANL